MNQLTVNQTKVSSNMQTYIPKDIQNHLGISAGQPISWLIKDGQVLVQKTASPLDTIKSSRGLAKTLYYQYGGGQKWLQKERQSWKKSV